MSDEGKLREQSARGENARRIIESDLVKEVLAKMEKTILDSITQSSGDEQDIRERAYLMFRLLGNFKAEFRSLVLTGDAASKELLRIKDPPKLKRMLFNGRR